jgi:hypothetical protein
MSSDESDEDNFQQLQEFEKKLQLLMQECKTLLTGQRETRDNFLEEAHEKIDELKGYSERLTRELETMNKSAELLKEIIKRDDYLDQYKDIIRA